MRLMSTLRNVLELRIIDARDNRLHVAFVQNPVIFTPEQKSWLVDARHIVHHRPLQQNGSATLHVAHQRCAPTFLQAVEPSHPNSVRVGFGLVVEHLIRCQPSKRKTLEQRSPHVAKRGRHGRGGGWRRRERCKRLRVDEHQLLNGVRVLRGKVHGEPTADAPSQQHHGLAHKLGPEVVQHAPLGLRRVAHLRGHLREPPPQDVNGPRVEARVLQQRHQAAELQAARVKPVQAQHLGAGAGWRVRGAGQQARARWGRRDAHLQVHGLPAGPNARGHAHPLQPRRQAARRLLLNVLHLGREKCGEGDRCLHARDSLRFY
mmetsp:Transcript_30214/g.58036  ORF Transcript_30214/g.58036 Transcript_30214/m.58036 type:complete len:318 (+) Transcript_30214:298-1251(+)